MIAHGSVFRNYFTPLCTVFVNFEVHMVLISAPLLLCIFASGWATLCLGYIRFISLVQTEARQQQKNNAL